MIKREQSSGNLFEDMGVPDAENMKIRAEFLHLSQMIFGGSP